MTSDISSRLQRCYTGAVYDVLRGMDRQDQVLPHTIRALDCSSRLAGPVFTASGRREEGADPHETLLAWTRLLSAVPPGAILVCQPNDDTLAHMGELSAETLQARGVRGYVVDGGCRDTEFILGIDFPVFCRYLTPTDIVGRWLATELGEPISIGGIAMASGDYLVADRDGIVVVTADIAEEVVSAAEGLMSTETSLRTAIRGGMDPKEAYLKYGVF